jgi:GNAT superfamily N-acetyltransferase
VSVLIREAGPSDVDLVERMRLLFLSDWQGKSQSDFGEGFVHRTRQFLERHAEAQTIRSWLAEDASDCVGIVSVVLLDFPPRPQDESSLVGYVINMYVAPHRRRQGVGKDLLVALMTACRASGVRKLLLHATSDGRPLYLEAGFVEPANFMELDLI